MYPSQRDSIKIKEDWTKLHADKTLAEISRGCMKRKPSRPGGWPVKMLNVKR